MTMSVRLIALALPAVLGLACKHAQRQKAETAAVPPQQTQEQQAAAQPAPMEHHGDQMVSGQVTKSSTYSITIQPLLGEERTLEIVPQTVVTVDGREATPLDLAEGQEVRASFSQESGRDVAVRIESLGTESQGGSGMPDQGTGEGTTSPEESGTVPPDSGMTPEP